VRFESELVTQLIFNVIEVFPRRKKGRERDVRKEQSSRCVTVYSRFRVENTMNVLYLKSKRNESDFDIISFECFSGLKIPCFEAQNV